MLLPFALYYLFTIFSYSKWSRKPLQIIDGKHIESSCHSPISPPHPLNGNPFPRCQPFLSGLSISVFLHFPREFFKCGRQKVLDSIYQICLLSFSVSIPLPLSPTLSIPLHPIRSLFFSPFIIFVFNFFWQSKIINF